MLSRVTCDLERLFGDLARLLPSDPDTTDAPFVITGDHLAVCETVIQSDHVVARAGTHDYGGHLADVVYLCFATEATCRQLGLLVLSSLLHPEPETVELVLTHPSSEIRRMRLRFPHPTTDNALSYWAVPTLVPYEPGLAERHLQPPDSLQDQPHIELTDAEESGHRRGRDTVVGFGNDRATAWIAEIMIDAGSGASGLTEVELETFAGFGGVGRHSAELRLCLPGSGFWNAFAEDFSASSSPLEP